VTPTGGSDISHTEEPRGAPEDAAVEDLLARATERRAYVQSDGKAGSSLERIVVDGEPYVVKWVHVDEDWTMRGWGDIEARPRLVFQHRLLDVVPDRIDHTVVAAARWGRNGWGAALVMRDVSPWLVPPGDAPLSEAQHLAFLDAMAALSARTWGWRDEIGLIPFSNRWLAFSDAWLDIERARGWPDPVPRIAADGWQRFAERGSAPAVDAVLELRRTPWPLTDALRATPACFLHGDWKLGNVGQHPDGRVILLDCTFPGEGPPCHELAWYLALNRARLPVGHTKETTITEFRAALARHGVATADWFDHQLALCLLGALVQFGWEKALGDDDELGWWCDAAVAGSALL
jgi:hypothetical protein